MLCWFRRPILKRITPSEISRYKLNYLNVFYLITLQILDLVLTFNSYLSIPITTEYNLLWKNYFQNSCQILTNLLSNLILKIKRSHHIREIFDHMRSLFTFENFIQSTGIVSWGVYIYFKKAFIFIWRYYALVFKWQKWFFQKWYY